MLSNLTIEVLWIVAETEMDFGDLTAEQAVEVKAGRGRAVELLNLYIEDGDGPSAVGIEAIVSTLAEVTA